jgi:c-di-GMP-binding flagellar brake protein YcgR
VPVQLTGVVRHRGSPSDGQEQSIQIVSHTIDLSGSGLSIHQSFSIPSETMLETRIWLDKDQPPIKLQARVVHCEPITAFRGRQIYRIALAFVEITEQQRHAIVRHVFAVQRTSLAG